MGLTLNSNSLTLEATGSGAAAGLSTADVNTLIKAASPWTFIEQVDVTSNTTAVILNMTSDYSTFKILIDQGKGSIPSYFRARYLTSPSSAGWVSSGYGFNGYRGRSSSNQYFNSENTSSVEFHNETTDHPKNIEFVFTTTKNSQRPVFRWHYGGGTSTYDPAFSIGGGQLNINTSTELVAMYIYPNVGDIASGSYKLYGLNNHG